VRQWLETEALPRFHSEHPDIHVTVQYVTWGDHQEGLLVETAAGVPPDVYIGGLWYDANGLSLPLDRLIASWADMGDILPPAIEDKVFEGEVHGLPYSVNLRHFF